MKQLVVSLFISLSLATPASSENDDDITDCADFILLAQDIEADGVRMIDEVTEFVETTVSCPLKTFTYFKRALIIEEQLPDNWKQLKQAGHTEVHCSDGGFASTFGWTAIDIIYDVDFQYLGTLATSPSDCTSP